MSKPDPNGSLKGFFTNSLIYLFGKIAMRGSGFILLPIYTGFLTKTDFGLLALSEVYRSILTTINTVGQGGSISYFSKRMGHDIRSVAGTALIIVAVWCLLLNGGILLFREPLMGLLFPSASNPNIITLIAIAAIFHSFHSVCCATLRFENRARTLTILEWVYSTLNLLLNITFIVIFELEFMGVLYSWVFTSMTLVIVETPLLLASAFRKRKGSLTKPMLRFGVPLIFNSLSNMIFLSADRIILGAFAGMEVLGMYALATKVASIPHALCVPFQQAYVPYVFELGRDQKKEMSKLCLVFLSAGSLFIATVTLFTPELIDFFGQGKYADALPLASWLITAYTFKIAYEALGFGPVYAGRPSILVTIVTITAILNMSLNLLWIPEHGAYGAMAGTVISLGIMSVTGIMVTTWLLGFQLKGAQLLAAAAVGVCLANALFGFYLSSLTIRSACFITLVSATSAMAIKLGYHKKLIKIFSKS